MLFDELSFHDAMILEVKEDAFNQSIDFLLEYPVDWEKNVFEKRILRFKNAVVYIKKEIPFTGYSTILEVKILNSGMYNFETSTGLLPASAYKVELITNSGSRIIEYSGNEFFAP